MPSVSVNIQPELLRWALSQTDEDQLGTKLVNNIYQWLDGKKTPTFNQIEYFSRKANIPLGYFFLQEPPIEKMDLLEYRTIDSIELANPSRNLIDTINEMERVQDWMKEYRQETGFDLLTFVGCLKGQSNPIYVAERIRSDLELDLDWYSKSKNVSDSFAFIREKMDEIGVIVMLNGIVGTNTHRALSIDEFRAFAMVDEWAPLIFINNADSQSAKLFSLFHELTHIWLGEDDFYNDRRENSNVKPLEVLCNAVASELLVPHVAFIDEWNSASAYDCRAKISILAKVFRCSESVIARKALSNNKIDKKMYDDIVNEAIEAYKILKAQKKDGGDYYNTAKARLDAAFVRALCESVVMGRTTFSEAYRLTNTSKKTFFEVAERLGGVI